MIASSRRPVAAQTPSVTTRLGRVTGALLLAGWTAATGCARGPQPEQTPVRAEELETAALERARAAADELGRRLMAALVEQLGSGGPATAIQVCSEMAPQVAGEISRDGLEIRRTSLRYRNPNNAPGEWERTWLERFESGVTAGTLPKDVHVVDDAGAELRYLRPILVASGCLPCHGPAERLAPEVRARLEERYPDDRATGFSVGDLRGAFSVRVALRVPEQG